MPGQQPYSSRPWDEQDHYGMPPRTERRKPIIRVVCPICASIVPVNAVEVENVTDTFCGKCDNTTISVATDDHGRIVSIEGWENVPEKKPHKPPDLKAMAVYGVVGLAIFFILIMALRQAFAPRVENAPTQASPARSMTAPRSEPPQTQRQMEEELSRPTQKDELPFSGVLNDQKGKAQTNQVTPTADMFAPEKN